MCLYPRKMINKKYTVTEKNGGCVPEPPIIGYNTDGTPIYDERVLYVEIPCGQCIECRRQKCREWQVRLNEEIKEWKYKYMVTLTFSMEELAKLLLDKKIQESNAACGYAIRHALEYYRKDYKHSLKHWFVSELGHQGTERIHLHGILFMNEEIWKDIKIIEVQQNGVRANWKYWKYGFIHIGNYCNERTVNYIIKYITKIDENNKTFKGQIFASPGIGKRFLNRIYTDKYKYRPGETINYYTLNTGSKVNLPKYYQNHLHNDEEKELIWRDQMDKEKDYISGNVYYNLEGQLKKNVQEKAQEINKKLGYGDDSREWRKQPHNITLRMIKHESTEYKHERYLKLMEKCKKLQN